MIGIQVFEPALCCNTGECDAEEVDVALVNFIGDMDWAKQQGTVIERFNLSQQPSAFTENLVVKQFLENTGVDGLPLILLDGEIVLSGQYPSRQALAEWAKIPFFDEVKEAKSNCCGGCC